MTFFRNILHDLVEKRLWPVALALCAALIAVPVMLKKEPEPAAGSAAGPSTATLADASVTAGDAPARSRLDVGKERNPFQENEPDKPKSNSGSTPGTSTTPSSGSTTTDAGSGTPSGGGGGSTDVTVDVDPTPTPVPDPPEPGEMAWTLDVKFGKDGDTKPLKAVLPGRALPNVSDPVLIYLSAIAGGDGARFLVNSDARAQGDGKCKPSEKTCTTIDVMEGDTAFFDVAEGDATVQYELELIDVVKRRVEE